MLNFFYRICLWYRAINDYFLDIFPLEKSMIFLEYLNKVLNYFYRLWLLDCLHMLSLLVWQNMSWNSETNFWKMYFKHENCSLFLCHMWRVANGLDNKAQRNWKISVKALLKWLRKLINDGTQGPTGQCCSKLKSLL